MIGAYASIFELSVALNITYAASKQFQDTLKSGFLYSIKNMDVKYSMAMDRINSDLSTISDRHIPKKTKKKFQDKFKRKLEALRENSTELNLELSDAQDIISKQVKPIYIYVAIFSLYCLFLAGQESVNMKFPLDGMNSLVYISLIMLPFFYIMGFFKQELSVSHAVIAIAIAIGAGLFSPITYLLPFTEKYLLDCALVIAYIPFIFSMSRLVYVTLKLEFSHRFSYWKSLYEIKKLEHSYQSIKESTEYIESR